MPTSVTGLVTDCPPIRMSPRLQSSRPATISINVLLPQPDGPTTDTNSPAAMSTVTSFSARNGLSVSSPKTFATRRIAIGTPHFASPAAAADVMSAGGRRRLGRRDRAQRFLGHEQRLAAALHDTLVLVHHLDVEDRDRLGGP